MKKLLYLLTISMTVFIVSACIKMDDSNLYIEKAELTEEEENIVKLLGAGMHDKIYDFTLDDKAQTMKINKYKLKDGKWHSDSNQFREFKDNDGRLALTFDNLANELKISIQSENKDGFSSHSVEDEEKYSHMSRATSYLSERTEIIYEKEIPLAIQIITSKDSVSSYNVEYFYSPEEYGKHGYEHVNAVTVMFSTKSVNELDDIKLEEVEEKLSKN